MYFASRTHLLENILQFVHVETDKWSSASSLREDYFRCLNRRQKLQLTASDSISISFEDGSLARSSVVNNMVSYEGAPTGHCSDEDERVAVSRNIRHALLLLNHLNPSLAGMIHLLVSDIVVLGASGSGGGTASNALGVIWLSPLRRWTTIDYAEALLHESMHLSVFMADMVHGLYIDARRVREPEALTTSAIRKQKRPIDKALHSACVAATLAYFYHALGDFKTSTSFLPGLSACITDIKGGPSRYLSSYGRRLVDELGRFVHTGSLSDFAEFVERPVHLPLAA